MATYPSNKGVGASLVIMGLTGQYIIIGIAAVVFLFILAIILSNTSIPVMATLLFIGIVAVIVLGGIITLHRRFGKYGIMKLRTLRTLPQFVKNTRVDKLIKNR